MPLGNLGPVTEIPVIRTEKLLLGGGRSVCCVPFPKRSSLEEVPDFTGAEFVFGGYLEGSYVFCSLRRATAVPWLQKSGSFFIFRDSAHRILVQCRVLRCEVIENLGSEGGFPPREGPGSVGGETRLFTALCCLVHSRAFKRS